MSRRDGRVLRTPPPLRTLVGPCNTALQGYLAQKKHTPTSLIRDTPLLGPYRRPMPSVPGGSWGGERFHMGEVPL